MLLAQESFCDTKPTIAVQSQKFLSVHRLADFEQIALFTPKTGAEFTNVAWNPTGFAQLFILRKYLRCVLLFNQDISFVVAKTMEK